MSSVEEHERALWRQYALSALPAPRRDSWAPTRPVEQSSIALITTGDFRTRAERGSEAGGSRPPEDEPFRMVTTTSSAPLFGHHGAEFDRVGLALDHNVAFPIDRLRERAAMGVVGSVASAHVSFACGSAALSGPHTARAGATVAERLRAAGVDLALLIPLCPACEPLIGVLAHAIESAGVATVSLVHRIEAAEHMRLPRALHVPFPLGRPFGRPQDPGFQNRVLTAALALTRHHRGPVCETFLERIEDEDLELHSLEVERENLLRSAAAEEATWLSSHMDLSDPLHPCSRGVGLAVSAERIAEALDTLALVADGAPLDAIPLPGPLPEMAADVRAFYELSAAWSVGVVPPAWSTTRWFYDQTEAGRLLLRVRAVLSRQGGSGGVVRTVVPANWAVGEVEARLVRSGMAFPRSMSWRSGLLYVGDVGSFEVLAIHPQGEIVRRIDTDFAPSGIAWHPDGAMIVVDGDAQQLRRNGDRSLGAVAALDTLGGSSTASGIALTRTGAAYVGSTTLSRYGLPTDARATLGSIVTSPVTLVTPEGRAMLVADDLISPRALALADGGATLLVAETYAQRITAFTVAPDGGLVKRRTWADLSDHDLAPQDLCVDAEGAVWVADAASRRVVRVAERGRVLGEHQFSHPCLSVALGGIDETTLFVVTVESLSRRAQAARPAAIWAMPVFRTRRFGPARLGGGSVAARSLRPSSPV